MVLNRISLFLKSISRVESINFSSWTKLPFYKIRTADEIWIHLQIITCIAKKKWVKKRSKFKLSLHGKVILSIGELAATT